MASLDEITGSVMKDSKICILIPTYNNGSTLMAVVNGCCKYTYSIIVVNDGSTDNTSELLNAFPNLIIHTQESNQGKGIAIKTGFRIALEHGYDYAITIDSDGQHLPEDIPIIVDFHRFNKDAIIIGSRNMEREGIPGKSSFGNKFSNFWFKFDTGVELPDTQSGYRLYPIRLIKDLKLITWKFEFEVEILVKAAWRNIQILPVPVRVYYPPSHIRVTHFRPFQDFTRISLLNTILFLQAFFWYIPLRWFRKILSVGFWKSFGKTLHDPKESVIRRSTSIAFGVFMGIFPVWGYQLIIGLTISHYLKLNKALFTLAAHISIPPMIPLILYFSYMIGGKIVSDPRKLNFSNFDYSINSLANNFEQYLVGAVILSIFAAVLAFYISFFIYKLFARTVPKLVS